MDSNVVGFWLSIWCVANLLLIEIWEFGCLMAGTGERAYVSFWLSKWSHESPVLVLVAGLVLGHILWHLNGNR